MEHAERKPPERRQTYPDDEKGRLPAPSQRHDRRDQNDEDYNDLDEGSGVCAGKQKVHGAGALSL